jgi:integrase
MIQRFVNTSEKSPKTVKNAISVLMVMWDMAKAWGYVQHNPFPRGTNGRLLLKLPSVVKGKAWSSTAKRWVDVFVFIPSETVAIIDKAKGRWKTFFRILAETGMRPGELAGLPVVGVGNRTICISQSVWQQQIQTPKTETAVREFAISSSLADEIHQLVAESEPNEYGLLFVTDPGRGKRNPGGKPLSMDNFRNRVLNPILDELGIRAKIQALGVRGGNYPFRHMNATVMDGLKTPLKTRQKRLGHADIATTLTHYSHAVDSDDLAAADALGALLSPKGTPAGKPLPELILFEEKEGPRYI